MEKERLTLREVKRKFIKNRTPTEVKRKIYLFLLVVERQILGVDVHTSPSSGMYGFIWANNT